VYQNQDNIGFKWIDYVYPGELRSNIGETVVSVLDKIKKALSGNFEFYFDEEGNFHFKEVKDYNNDNSSNQASLLIEKADGNVVYSFTDGSLFISCSNNPVYQNIKNDITIWGKTSDNAAPVRYHLILDKEISNWETQRFAILDTVRDALGNIKAKSVSAGGGDIVPGCY
jgi:hypothetical protein